MYENPFPRKSLLRDFVYFINVKQSEIYSLGIRYRRHHIMTMIPVYRI